jgi:uncharacterized protein (TIGR03435 family)
MFLRIAAGCALLLIVPPAPGQPTPAFEVASIKPSEPGQATAIRRSGNRIAFVNTSLEFLITWAYDLYSDQLFGRPKWLDFTRFDILANAPEQSDFKPRMRTLLADRFHLSVHSETRELPVYILVEAKDGPKLTLAPMPQTMGQNPFAMPGRGRLIGTQVTAEMLAKVLSGQLGRTVRDASGLQGVFDFKLEWDPDGTAGGASLFTAVQEQLGLKLEARKGPVEVLVIDHIDQVPTEN